jgi:hypothetical protein
MSSSSRPYGLTWGQNSGGQGPPVGAGEAAGPFRVGADLLQQQVPNIQGQARRGPGCARPCGDVGPARFAEHTGTVPAASDVLGLRPCG